MIMCLPSSTLCNLDGHIDFLLHHELMEQGLEDAYAVASSLEPHVVEEYPLSSINDDAYSHCWLDGVHCWLGDSHPPLFAVEGTNIEEGEGVGGLIAIQ